MSTTTSYFSEAELARISSQAVPRHIAIIMDGNRRWAASHAETTAAGHTQGADTLMDIIKAGKELGVKVVTTYAFSTENWKRSSDEVTTLITLLEHYLRDEQGNMIANGVQLQTIGELSLFPQSARDQIEATRQATAHCNCITLVLALNYGGRDDIVRAVRHLVDDYAEGRLNAEQISEAEISSRLDTSRWPDPELLIRTSGEMRISNFLLWQLQYSELYMTETLWPDFSPKHLLRAVEEFQQRERRHGQ